MEHDVVRDEADSARERLESAFFGEEMTRLVVEALRRRIEAFILVNNRAEGNAPGTIRAVAELLRGDAGPGSGVSGREPHAG